MHVGVAEALPSWVADLRGNGTCVVGGVGWDSTGVWRGSVLDRLAEVDVFVPNDIEAMRYTRTESARAAAERLAERVPLAVVTRGGDGVIGIDSAAGVVVELPSVVVDVVDPTGRATSSWPRSWPPVSTTTGTWPPSSASPGSTPRCR